MIETPISLTDLQLAQRALKDRKSEEMLLRRVYPRIVQIVRMATENASQSADYAQLAAIEVVRSLKSYRGIGSLESWAGRIAYRTAMRGTVRQRRKESGTMPLLDYDAVDRETPEKSISRRQLFETLMENMSVIPENRREPLLLHLAFGYSVREVSQMTDSPVDTVKYRLKIAFREFQSILDAHPEFARTMTEEL